MNSISKITEPEEKSRWNLCRFCGAQHNQDNSMNEIFLEVTNKLFSFSIEYLKTYKICDECNAHIEYICKFYKQVQNVSETVFKIKNSSKVVHLPPLKELNSNSNFKDDQDDSFHEITEVNSNTFYFLLKDTKEPDMVSLKDITQVDIDENNDVSQIDIAIKKEIPKIVHIADHKDVPQIDIVINKEIPTVDIDKHDGFPQIDAGNSSFQYNKRDGEDNCYDSDENDSVENIERINQDLVEEARNAINWNEISLKTDFECEICGKILRSRTCLKFHQKLHMTEEEKQANFFKCTHCGKMYPRRKSLQHHIKFKHSEEKKGEYVCNICGKMFIFQHSLRSHQKVVHKMVFKREIKYNNSERKHKCELCEKIFKRKYHLKQHQIVHMSDEQKQANSVKCPYCDNRYFTRRTMRHHVVHKHLNNKKQFKRKESTCDICNKVLSCRSSLILHVKRVHQNITGGPKYKPKEFACEICGKIIAIYNLKVHQIVHMSDEEKEQSRIHKCQHCDAKYFRRDSLIVHIQSKHSKENPFVCKICDKVFAYRSCLVLHQKTFHDEIKPEWRCEICSKTFLHKRSLSNHKKKIHEQCE